MINQKQNKLMKKRYEILNYDLEAINDHCYYINSLKYKLYNCYIKGKGLKFGMRYRIIEEDIQP